MCKCKNCGDETKKKNIYCSLTCRNIYVNKNLRDYTKLKDINKKKKDLAKIKYYENPIKCKNCGATIEFEKNWKNVSFCNHSCSAEYSNKRRSGYEYNLTENGLNSIINSNKNRSGNVSGEYYKNPKCCLNCGKIIEYSKRNNGNCSWKCRKEYYTKNKEEYQVYYELSKFKFNLRDFNEEFDFSLIERYGWYKAKNNGDNVDGVSRDHMFSVKEGFRRLINPLLLAHPANCELIINRQNQSKCDSCSLTIEELLEKIKKFENKYGLYYDKELKIYVELKEIKQMVP